MRPPGAGFPPAGDFCTTHLGYTPIRTITTGGLL
jgi:hypothetical protein